MIKKRLGQLRYVKNIWQVWRLLTSKVKSIEIAINMACNRNCPGCYVRYLRKDQKSLFMTAEDVKEICEKYKPAHINITGGEPMLNPHIFDIIKVIPKSTIVSMVTNGDMLSKPVSGLIKLDKLKNAGLNTIQISYGSNYNMELNEILAMTAEYVGLNVCLSVVNIYKERKNIERAIKLASIVIKDKKSYKKATYHVLFNTPGVGLEKEFDYQTYFTYRKHPLVREDNMFWAGCDVCPAGIKKFYIAADGTLYPCDRMHDKKYDNYEDMCSEFKCKEKTYCRRYDVKNELINI